VDDDDDDGDDGDDGDDMGPLMRPFYPCEASRSGSLRLFCLQSC